MLTGLVAGCGNHQPAAPPPVAALNPPQTGPIRSGVGFAVTADGYIVAPAHIVAGCSAVRVSQPALLAIAKLVASDSATDIALIKVSVATPVFALFRDEAGPHVDDTAVTYRPARLGQPANDQTYDMGKVNAVEAGRAATRFLADTVDVAASVTGESQADGAPIFDFKAQIVGMYEGTGGRRPDVAAPKGATNAVTSATIRRFLDGQKVKYATGKPTAGNGNGSMREFNENPSRFSFHLACVP